MEELGKRINEEVSLFRITAKLKLTDNGEMALLFTDEGDGSAEMLTKMLGG